MMRDLEAKMLEEARKLVNKRWKDKFVDYAHFQRYMANYGFIKTPLSRRQFVRCQKNPINTVYGIACDVNAGVPFEKALEANHASAS